MSDEQPRGADAALRVLLVEDSRLVADLLREVLGSAGHEVVVAGSLAAARTALAGPRFDVVVADLRLPDGRGEQVVEAARARDPATAIIVASGEEEEEPIEGADAVMVKPFLPDALKAAIRRVLERRSARR